MAACLVLVAAERLHLRRVRVIAKLTASAAFVALGALGLLGALGGAGGRGDLGRLIVGGLVLGAVGDACLLVDGKRWFLAGLAAFLAGHVAYVAAMAVLVPIPAWPAAAGGWAALPAVAGALALTWLWPRLGAMRGPVIAYVITICVMVIAAIAVARGKTLPPPNRIRLLLGASLFFVSDLSVARDRFVAREFANKLYGLPAYYAGQLFIAWTLAGL
ncbi:MAG TPA: lysoplasmalogenase [Kofleriaceae bacterium]|nr:lysoplasmalogenase [Kofleriaceae bacterium]